MRFSTVALSGLSAASGTSVYMRMYGVSVYSPAGEVASARLDPRSSTTSTSHEGETVFSLRSDHADAWEDKAAVALESGETGVVGLAPGSAYMTKHGIVTLNSNWDEIVIGAYDASALCVEGRMFFAPQAEDFTAWTLPLQWTDRFGTETVNFQLSGAERGFLVPQGIHLNFKGSFENEKAELEAQGGAPYLTADEMEHMGNVEMSLDGFKLTLTPREYILDGPRTIFQSADSREPFLSTPILNKLVLQLDAVNRRVGVCTATFPSAAVSGPDPALETSTVADNVASYPANGEIIAIPEDWPEDEVERTAQENSANAGNLAVYDGNGEIIAIPEDWPEDEHVEAGDASDVLSVAEREAPVVDANEAAVEAVNDASDGSDDEGGSNAGDEAGVVTAAPDAPGGSDSVTHTEEPVDGSDDQEIVNDSVFVGEVTTAAPTEDADADHVSTADSSVVEAGSDE